MLADELDYVVGVDTHRDEHALAVVGAPAGAVVAQRSVRASARGYAAAVHFADTHANGARVWVVEGAGHYGAGLARYLSGRGETVLEVGRGPRDERRLRGKDDSLDAIRAARTALASETLAMPRAGQRREALRLLLLARRSAVDVRREALVQLRSVVVTAPDGLREQLRGLPVQRLGVACSRLQSSRLKWCNPDSSIRRGSGRGELDHLLALSIALVLDFEGEGESDRLGRQVLAADQPFVVLLD
jgi:transposase